MGFNILIGLGGEVGYEKYFPKYIIIIHPELRTTYGYLESENGAGPL